MSVDAAARLAAEIHEAIGSDKMRLEKLRAFAIRAQDLLDLALPYLEAFARGEHISACLMHRCVSHRDVPQLNTTESSGAECGACVRDMTRVADAMQAELHRAQRNGYCNADEEVEHTWVYETEDGRAISDVSEAEARTCGRCGYQEICDECSWGPP